MFCNGEEVLSLGGSKDKYVVDLWSGNHPFFQGVQTTVVVNEGQVNRFKKRFAGLEMLSKVDTVSSEKIKKDAAAAAGGAAPVAAPVKAAPKKAAKK